MATDPERSSKAQSSSFFLSSLHTIGSLAHGFLLACKITATIINYVVMGDHRDVRCLN